MPGLKLNTASGGSVSIEPTNTASNYTLTVPAQTGTVVASDSSGNVGIGTSSPQKKLSVANGAVLAGNSGQVLVGRYDASFPGTATNGYFSLDTNNIDGTNGGLTFKTLTSDSLTEKMRIDSSGVLLINRTSYQSGITSNCKLQVLGVNGEWVSTFENPGASPSGINIKYTGATPNNTGNEFVYFNDSTAVRFVARSNGGLANYSANNVNLSDIRTKTDINLAGSYLDKICAIPVKTFKYKDQTDDELNLGVIAQDVEAVAPELVDVSGFGEIPEDGVPLKAVYQTDLQYALMKCIQEQQAIITSQASAITALEARLTALENK